MRQFFEAADLDLVVFLVRAGMVGLVAEQFEAGGELMPLTSATYCTCVLLTKAGIQIESKIIYRNHLRGGLERDAVPAEQAGDLQVTGRWQEAYEDQRCG